MSISVSDAEQDQKESEEEPDEGQQNLRLSLSHHSLKELNFLTKFVREFPKIQHIDLGDNEISNHEMEKFMGTLEENRHIQDIEIGGNKNIAGYLKSKMELELKKNKQINGLMENNLVDLSKKG